MTCKCMNSLAAKYLCDLFHKRIELNNHVTRNNKALIINHNKTKSFRSRAVGLWNSLDKSLP